MPRILDVGRENAEFQHLEVLKRNRTKRKQYGEVFVEGVAGINALTGAKWAVRTVAYNREKNLSRWAQETIAKANPDKILRLAPELMEKLSDREDPSELIVLAERQERQLRDLRIGDRSVVVVFDRPSNHGNLGSIIRSCDAFGATALVTTGHAVDPFDPAVIRASLGAFFTVPLVHAPSPKDIQGWLEGTKRVVPGLRVAGAVAGAPKAIFQADFTGPLVVILGNEADGISRSLSDLIDEPLAIPMAGTVDSINVACAGTVVMYEVMRQRMQAGS